MRRASVWGLAFVGWGLRVGSSFCFFLVFAPRVCVPGDGCNDSGNTSKRRNATEKTRASTCNSGCLEAARARAFCQRSRRWRRELPRHPQPPLPAPVRRRATERGGDNRRERSPLSRTHFHPALSLTHAPSARAPATTTPCVCVPTNSEPNDRGGSKTQRQEADKPLSCFFCAPGRPKALSRAPAHTQAAATAVAPITVHATAP